MIKFVYAESKKLKLPKSARRRFFHHQYGWRKQENIRRLPILIKIIYATIFISLTIYTNLNRSIDDNNNCSKSLVIRIWDLWELVLAFILLLSLLVDRLKRQNLLSLKLINIIQSSLVISFISFVILGHVQAYQHLWRSSSLSSSNEWTHSTLVSIVLIDICPMSIAVIITINSLKKRRSCRRVHASRIISSV